MRSHRWPFGCAVILTIGFSQVGYAATWQPMGADKDAFGGDMRVVEIDADSGFHSVQSEVTVRERVTNNSISSVGYNCSEGEIRHGNTPKNVANLICDKPSSPRGPHVPKWVTLQSTGTPTATGSIETQIDLNSLIRSNQLVMVSQKSVDVTVKLIHFDCKGYYKLDRNWITLDTTDHTAFSPRGFVSLERKTSNKACSVAPPGK